MANLEPFEKVGEAGCLPDVDFYSIEIGSSSSADMKTQCIRIDPRPHACHASRRYCPAIALAAITLAVTLAVLARVAHLDPPQRRPEQMQGSSKFSSKMQSYSLALTDCGSTPSEAKSKGCVFDLMNYAWTPKDCYDGELSQESLRSGPWNFYLDEAATTPVPGGQDLNVLGGLSTVWNGLDFHVAHCVYTWKLLHKSAINGQPLLDALISFNHTVHCSDLIQSYADRREVVSRTDLKFRPCVLLG